MKILHTCLNVTDLDRSIEFYTKELGLKFASRREVKQNNAEIAFLKDSGEGALELTHWRDKKSISEGDNFDHIAFETEHIDQKGAELRSHGVAIAMEPFSLHGPQTRLLS
jgi:lactoylglutathione lyase